MHYGHEIVSPTRKQIANRTQRPIADVIDDAAYFAVVSYPADNPEEFRGLSGAERTKLIHSVGAYNLASSLGVYGDLPTTTADRLRAAIDRRLSAR